MTDKELFAAIRLHGCVVSKCEGEYRVSLALTSEAIKGNKDKAEAYAAYFHFGHTKEDKEQAKIAALAYAEELGDGFVTKENPYSTMHLN